MIISKINSRMQELCGPGLAMPQVPLPRELKAATESGTVDVDGCVFVKSLFEKAHAGRDDFPDATGYECFVNHVHVDDFVDTGMIPVAISFLDELSRGLRRDYPGRRFRGIVTEDGSSCTVRFHVVRLGEDLLSDNLDEYEEGVCVLDL